MAVKNSKKARCKYDAAFREEVLKMVFNGRAIKDIAQSMDISENLIYRRKNRGKKAEPKGENKAGGLAEIETLNKRIRELETERDILKKALAIFCRQS